jgi:hypothetical protein
MNRGGKQSDPGSIQMKKGHGDKPSGDKKTLESGKGSVPAFDIIFLYKPLNILFGNGLHHIVMLQLLLSHESFLPYDANFQT